jgi:hypothetical protein
MVAAILCRDDGLLDWLKIVAEIRYNTELCQEYQAVLPYEDLFQWRDYDNLSHEVYKHALMMVADIESRLAAEERYGISKI